MVSLIWLQPPCLPATEHKQEIVGTSSGIKRRPGGSTNNPRFSSALWNTSSRQTPSFTTYNTPSSKELKISQSFNNNYNSFNTNITIADDRLNILAWLSPLDPKFRHRDIQGRQVENIGEWLLQAEEFRSWYTIGGEGESDNAVLFCYGDPGVGKTFIR